MVTGQYTVRVPDCTINFNGGLKWCKFTLISNNNFITTLLECARMSNRSTCLFALREGKRPVSVSTTYFQMRQVTLKWSTVSEISKCYPFQLFDGLKKSHGLPFLLSKCSIMSGDCSALDLDMSASDRQTVIEEVSIVYHCAATIRFDETLKKAVLLNTRGTKCMLDLAEQMKNLAVSVPMLM